MASLYLGFDRWFNRKTSLLNLWNLRNGSPDKTFSNIPLPVDELEFSADGKQILSNTASLGFGQGSEIRFLDLATGETLFNYYMPHPNNGFLLFKPAYTPNGLSVVSQDTSGNILLMDLSSETRVDTLLPSSNIIATAISPLGDEVLFSTIVYPTEPGVMPYPSIFTIDTQAGMTKNTIDTLSVNKLVMFARYSPQSQFFALAEASFMPGSAVKTYINVYRKNTQEKIHSFELSETSIGDLAFSQDEKLLITGTVTGLIQIWDIETGHNIWEVKGHEGRVESVAFSSDGQLAASGCITTGKTKLWDVQTGEELISLISLDANDWVVTTPKGLFDASAGAMQRMHYALTYEGEKERIELEQLKLLYYEPGLLQKVMGYSDDAIRPVDNLDDIPLYAKIVEADIRNDSLFIKLKERNGGIGKTSIFINGKEVIEDADPLDRGQLKRNNTDVVYSLKPHLAYLYKDPKKTNIVSIRVFNEEEWIKSASYDLAYSPDTSTKGQANNAPQDWVAQSTAKMYVVAIGTSNYSGEALDLQFANQDAIAMARAMHSVGSNLFTNGDSLEVYCLTANDKDALELADKNINWRFANKQNIRSTLQEIATKAKAEDVLMVYLSGHGITYGADNLEQFYYLTHGIANQGMIANVRTREQYTIPSEELTRWINKIPALKQVLIIDACNSGQIIDDLSKSSISLNSSQIRALDRMKDRTGMFILSGSAADKVSYEAGAYGQGLMTYALLEGMISKSIKTKDGNYVDVMTLFQHARDEVPQLASSINGIQTPVMGFPSQASSFDIGLLHGSEDIPLATKKPLIIQPRFIDQNSMNDHLQIEHQVELAFREETEKKVNADFIFIDVKVHPNAYAVSGIYEQRDGAIFLNARLFQGDQRIADLEIEPTYEPEMLTKFILRAVKKQLKISEQEE